MTAVPGLRARASGNLGSNYWRLWSASAASNLADGIFWIAFPLLAISLTDSPALVAGVVVVGRLPWLLFVLVAGALADRLDRRRTMLAVAILRSGVSIAIAATIVSDVVSLPILYVAAFVLGVGETLFDTAAQSIMPNIVDRDRLSQANGRLYAVELTMNQFVGPPVGGLLAGLAIGFAFAGSAVAFAIAAAFLALLTGSFQPTPRAVKTSVIADIREGLHYLFAHRLLRTLAIMVGTMNLASSAAFAILVLYAVSPGPMGLDALGFGILTTTLAVGSLVGSVAVERLEVRLGRARLLALTVVLNAITIAVPGLTANAWVIGASFAVMGFGIMLWNIVTVSLRQRIVPNALLGRVNASYRLLAWGTQPIGAILGGLIAEAFGLQAVFLFAAIVTGMLIVARAIVTDAAIVEAEREGAADAARLAATGASAESAGSA